LAPGKEHKTAFQTHISQFEFKVTALRLIGAPATFQDVMNVTLTPVFRNFAVVFFDDILNYSPSYKEHLQHLSAVLAILLKDQWKFKYIMYVFSHHSVAYLGHAVSEAGGATNS
jgi:hypothetical protein